ncbi:MAG: alpha/beta hydrolase [Chloroflexi bacterium]|nr:alpha/beta hydrolase [Chloroflexota bacterium]
MELEVISRQPSGTARPTPLLFVHGMWHGAWIWEEHFFPYFVERGYAVHALSLRGHGNSEGSKNIRWHRIGSYVQDVAQVASTLDTPPVIIGHSMGGYVTQKYLENHPAAAGVLLASAPPGHGVWQATFRALAKHPLAVLRVNLTFSMRPLVATPERYRWVFFTPDFPEDTLRRYHAQINNESIVAFLGLLGLSRLHPRRVKVPMLVTGAEQDTLFSTAEIEGTARAYGTSAEIFPNVGHNMMLDTGWQAVGERIASWLDEQEL